jgi:hypothetical protein
MENPTFKDTFDKWIFTTGYKWVYNGYWDEA